MRESETRKLAGLFWKRVGKHVPYPRELWMPIQRAFPVSIRQIEGLSVSAVYKELAFLGCDETSGNPDRPLRGCLVAFKGNGIIFLDASDPPADKRFSLAHEAAHFIIDHWEPRTAVAREITPETVEVFDGERAPTVAERFKGITRGVMIRAYEHFMDRSADGTIQLSPVLLAEDKADRLALELLAPASTVIGDRKKSGEPASQKSLSMVLVGKFGLPDSVAASYGRFLFSNYVPEPSLRERFRKK